MFGVRTTPFEYVLEEDKEREEKYRTKFFIRQKTIETENEIIGLYRSASTTSKRGSVSLSFSKTGMTKADIEAFKLIVDRVENFFVPFDAPVIFGYDPFNHFKSFTDAVEEEISGVKYLKLSTVSGEDLKYVSVCLTTAQRNEIFNVSEDVSRLSETEKKD
ncbi:hypothetical protein C4561_01585 [candidate division WWE3 bacterium]|jgi:hypothetical protein|uniref:Uncharacterized protein n=1 Tax=candidate division WWE3 bacterium TaxID=2053526 RepID=A0A3A4ZF21_UNCKA|nr:MAG: hypothetical protein C4561_01585 [candidate division WWE3 bacterium]